MGVTRRREAACENDGYGGGQEARVGLQVGDGIVGGEEEKGADGEEGGYRGYSRPMSVG